MFDKLKELLKKGAKVAGGIIVQRLISRSSSSTPAESYYERIRELERQLESCRANNRYLNARLEEMDRQLWMLRIWSIVATAIAVILGVILIMR